MFQIHKLISSAFFLFIFVFALPLCSKSGEVTFSDPVIIDTARNLSLVGDIKVPNNGSLAAVGVGPSFDLVFMGLAERGIYEMIRVDRNGELIDTIPRLYRPVSDSVKDDRSEFTIRKVFWIETCFYVIEQKGEVLYYVRVSDELELLDPSPINFVSYDQSFVFDNNSVWTKSQRFSELFKFPQSAPTTRVDDNITWSPLRLVGNNGIYLLYYNINDSTVVLGYGYPDGQFLPYDPLPVENDFWWRHTSTGIKCGLDSALYYTVVRDNSNIYSIEYLLVSPHDTISPLTVKAVEFPPPFNTESPFVEGAYAMEGSAVFLVEDYIGQNKQRLYFKIDLTNDSISESKLFSTEQIPSAATALIMLPHDSDVFIYFDSLGSTHLTSFSLGNIENSLVTKSLRYSAEIHFRPSLVFDDSGLLVLGEKISQSGNSIMGARFANIQDVTNYKLIQPDLPGMFQELPVILGTDSEKALYWIQRDTIDSQNQLLKHLLCFFDGDSPTTEELNSLLELNQSNWYYRPTSVVIDSLMYLTIDYGDGYAGADSYLRSIDLNDHQLTSFEYRYPPAPYEYEFEVPTSALIVNGDSVIVVWSDVNCTGWSNIGCTESAYRNVYSVLHQNIQQTQQTFGSFYYYYADGISKFQTAIISGETILLRDRPFSILRFNRLTRVLENITGLWPYLTVADNGSNHYEPQIVETNDFIIVAAVRDYPRNSELVIFNKNWQFIETLDFPMTGLRRDVSEFFYVPEVNRVFYCYSTYLPYPYSSERILLQSFQLDISTDVIGEDAVLPDQFKLEQNYPNPFNPETVIEFQLPTRSSVELVIYNILGQVVSQIANSEYSAGNHRITWNGKNSTGEAMASGIYFYRLVTDAFVETKKMVLVR